MDRQPRSDGGRTGRVTTRTRLRTLVPALTLGLVAATLLAPQAALAFPPPEAYPVYSQPTCLPTPVEQPGVQDFRAMLIAKYGPRNGGIFACSGYEHGEGRAFDFMVNHFDPAEDAIANEVLNWLFATVDGYPHAMARRLGIGNVIWNGQSIELWSYNSNKAWRPYTPCVPGAPAGVCHTNHIHFAFSWAGARRQTSWFTTSPRPAAWFPGGSRAGQAADGPVGTDGNGTIDVFHTTATRTLGHNWTSPGQGWAGETFSASAASAPSVAVTGIGVVDVFWKGTDNNLWHRWYAPGIGWLGPENLGMGPLGGPPRAVGQSDGTVDVFWKGTDNGLWHGFYINGIGWHGPEAMGGSLGSDPSAVVTSGGTLDVFWRGTDNNLWHKWYAPGIGWLGPENLGMGPLGGPPRAVGQPDGTVDVFWKGTDNGLWHGFYLNGVGWHGPQGLGGSVNSEPSAAVTSGGTVDVFWRGTDNNLWHRWYVAGLGWLGPESLGMGPLGGPPRAVGQPDGTVDVFWKGTDGRLKHAWYQPASTWSGPENLGGSVSLL